MIGDAPTAFVAPAQPAAGVTPPSPTLPVDAYAAAVAARRAGDEAAAARILASLIERDPANADALVQYGYALHALGRAREAGAAFERALAIAPAYQDAIDGLALLRGKGEASNALARAIEARRAGQEDRAAAILEERLAADPNDADALVQYGYVLRALNRPAEAEAAFERALAIAPDYADASRGLAFVRSDLRANSPWSLDLGAARVAVAQGQPDWRELALQLRFAPDVSHALAARVEPTRRFGKSDTYVEGRGELRLRDDLRFYALAGGTPNADFLARWRLGAGGSARLTGGSSPWVATLDTQRAAYASGKVTLVNPGVEKYLSDGRAWLTGRMINLFQGGRHMTGWFARADVQPTRRLRLFAGAAEAPDLAGGTPIDTKSLFGGVVAAIGQRVELRLDAGRDRPELGPRRTRIGVGLGLRLP